MVDESFNTALEECITGLANGESLAEVLSRYPEFETDLRSLLESGLIVRELQASDAEVAISQARVAKRFETVLSAPVTNRPNRRWWRGLSLAVATIVIFLFANVALAQNSLPDDWNYGIKRSSEAVFLLITGNEGQFTGRRFNEIRRLLASERVASVTFEGEVIEIQDNQFLIVGLDEPIEAPTELLSTLSVNQRVQITGRTTLDGLIVAEGIEILSDVETDGEIIASPVSTITATSTREVSRTATTPPTPTETANPTEPTAEADNQVTCVVSIPDGWIAYTLQSGDTLFALATRSGTSLERVSRVNCIADPSVVSVGRTIYLPVPRSNNESQSTSPTAVDNREERPPEQAPATRPPVRPTETPSRSR